MKKEEPKNVVTDLIADYSVQLLKKYRELDENVKSDYVTLESLVDNFDDITELYEKYINSLLFFHTETIKDLSLKLEKAKIENSYLNSALEKVYPHIKIKT